MRSRVRAEWIEQAENKRTLLGHRKGHDLPITYLRDWSVVSMTLVSQQVVHVARLSERRWDPEDGPPLSETLPELMRTSSTTLRVLEGWALLDGFDSITPVLVRSKTSDHEDDANEDSSAAEDVSPVLAAGPYIRVRVIEGSDQVGGTLIFWDEDAARFDLHGCESNHFLMELTVPQGYLDAVSRELDSNPTAPIRIACNVELYEDSSQRSFAMPGAPLNFLLPHRSQARAALASISVGERPAMPNFDGCSEDMDDDRGEMSGGAATNEHAQNNNAGDHLRRGVIGDVQNSILIAAVIIALAIIFS